MQAYYLVKVAVCFVLQPRNCQPKFCGTHMKKHFWEEHFHTGKKPQVHKNLMKKSDKMCRCIENSRIFMQIIMKQWVQ